MEAIFEYIRRHITEDARLPEDFCLPGSTNGARDGIYMHNSTPTEPDAACRAALERLVEQLATCDVPEEGMGLIAPFAAQYPAITVAGALGENIAKQFDEGNPFMLANLAMIGVWIALNATEIECVKYGLLLCEISRVGEWSEPAKDIVLLLGLCEEFTAFSVFNVRHWEGGGEEIVLLAGQVSGWGRIAAVEFLEPEEEWMEDWLLDEGWRNSVFPLYSALVCYNKAKVPSRFGKIRETVEFLAVQELMDCLTQTDELMDQLTLNRAELRQLELLLRECEQHPDLADGAMMERIRAYLDA